jgi:phosphoenolpyruvate carboxykinase (ATP)
MYQFISGYTAKVAGTETGITEPKPTFSACFGAPFLPLHPAKYAEMLGKQMEQHKVNVWLINTGWSGGAHGTGSGSRIKLSYTRAMITAALEGKLDKTEYAFDPVFGFAVPQDCSGYRMKYKSRNTWKDKEAYDQRAAFLVDLFKRILKNTPRCF